MYMYQVYKLAFGLRVGIKFHRNHFQHCINYAMHMLLKYYNKMNLLTVLICLVSALQKTKKDKNYMYYLKIILQEYGF